MWSRQVVKERGKTTFKANYWKTVLISLIVALLTGGGLFTYKFDFPSNKQNYTENYYYNYGSTDGNNRYDKIINDANIYHNNKYNDTNYNVDSFFSNAAVSFVFIMIFLFIFIIAFVIGMAIKAFLINPLEIGTRRFFLVNLHEPGNVKEVGYGFDNCYKNIVNVMFFRDLFTVLWTLLFIIPGIIKSYEYRMIPYIMVEHPDMSRQQAFELSKQMMNGQKWNAFVFDLSFIGWFLLTIFTFGLLNIFYTAPYYNMSSAALYEAIRYDYVAKNSQN